jgi:flagellar L-ring protein precursor FlgH
MRRLLAVPGLVLMAGCATDIRDIGREPHMTPVGSGLQADVAAIAPRNFPPPTRSGDLSLWDDGRADLFRDPRATRVGDVVTVLISIDDKAKLDNTSGRSQDSKANVGFDVALGMTSKSRKANGLADATSSSSSTGQGNIDRSEQIRVALGAVVQGVLPDGNLLVSGSQEVRVNFELRMLNIAGIVRPRDISKDNTIAYDKIAEARISYGGRGRITEVQQPQWGQQIYDWLKPF